jgi:hypothetical protein
MKSLMTFIVLFMSAFAGQGYSASKPVDTFTPILVSIFEETPPVLGSDNQYYLIYGLLLTNASRLEAGLDKIEVFNSEKPASPLKTYQGKDLISHLRHLNSLLADSVAIGQDASRLLFVSLSFKDKASIPKELHHRITAHGATGPGSREATPITYEAARFTVSTKAPIVISPPVKKGPWITFNGCCSFQGAHQAMVIPVNGALYNAQRFAIDFMLLDRKGSLVEGDSSVPANWHSYKQEIFAVEDGTVISVLDGLPDQPPGELPDPNTITSENYTGNHVVLKIDDGHYAFYAHLRNGGIKVKKGDRVSKGEMIAHLGNSGNTSAPHLHLHLMDGPSPIGSNPVPYVFGSFEILDQVKEEVFYGSDELPETFGNPAKYTPVLHRKQLPLDLTVVQY